MDTFWSIHIHICIVSVPHAMDMDILYICTHGVDMDMDMCLNTDLWEGSTCDSKTIYYTLCGIASQPATSSTSFSMSGIFETVRTSESWIRLRELHECKQRRA